MFNRIAILGLCVLATGCLPTVSEPVPGPDKQAVGTWYGAAMGAGSGAITGAQLSVGTGPGAMVGAGIGAAYGMFAGLGQDVLEEDQLIRNDEEEKLRARSWAQSVLAEHYAKRMEVHPNRDIFPADLFFEADSAELRPGAAVIVDELALLTKQRMPWSRIVVASYLSTTDLESAYAEYITQKRAERIAMAFVRTGMDPRRVIVQGVPMPDVLVVDPYDSPNRYRQAIELIPLDY